MLGMRCLTDGEHFGELVNGGLYTRDVLFSVVEGNFVVPCMKLNDLHFGRWSPVLQTSCCRAHDTSKTSSGVWFPETSSGRFGICSFVSVSPCPPETESNHFIGSCQGNFRGKLKLFYQNFKSRCYIPTAKAGGFSYEILMD